MYIIQEYHLLPPMQLVQSEEEMGPFLFVYTSLGYVEPFVGN
jgi:hypothetical protein